MKSLLLPLAGLLVLFGIVSPTLIGLLTPGYNPLAQYLSELGATGAPNAALMNLGGFLPAGVLWGIACVLLWLTAGRGSLAALACLLLLSTSVSYIGAAFNPCDAGCPSSGSASQSLHNLFGVLGYLLTPPAQTLLAAHLYASGRMRLGGQTLLASGCAALGFVLMVSQPGGALMGLWQRLADFSTLGWMAFMLVTLSRPQAAQATEVPPAAT